MLDSKPLACHCSSKYYLQFTLLIMYIKLWINSGMVPHLGLTTHENSKCFTQAGGIVVLHSEWHMIWS
jgi:hypothetical protein